MQASASEDLGGREAGECDRIPAQLLDYRRTLATEPAYVGRRDLGEPDVVAGPAVDATGEPLQLRPPARVVLGYARRPVAELA